MGSSCGKIPIVLVEIYLQKTLFFLTCMNEEVEEKLKTSIYSHRLGELRTCMTVFFSLIMLSIASLLFSVGALQIAA